MTESEQIQVEGGTVEITNTPPQPTAPQDPSELAATAFTLFLPKFQQAIVGLSNKQLKRVLQALIEHPLYDKNPKFTSDNERNAFAYGNHLIEAKSVMVMHTLFSEQALSQVNWAKNEEKKDEEVNNGKEES